MMNRRTTFAASLALVIACGGSSPDPGAKTKPLPIKRDPLWSYAPADWIGAFVVADGELRGLDRAVDEIRRITTSVGGNQLLAGARALVRAPAGFDILDPSSLADVGVDIDLGTAVFVRPDFSVTTVIGISDREKLRATFGGSQSGADDLFGDARCSIRAGRYVCSSTSDAAAASSSPPRKAQGIVIAARAPEGSGDLSAAFGGPVLGLRSADAEIKLADGRVSVHSNIDMDPPAGWLKARRRRAPSALTSIDERAFGFLRLRIPPRILRQLPWPKKGPIDAGEILAPELTGDVAIVSSAAHPLAFHLVLGLRDANSVRLALRSTCRLASFAGIGSFAWRNERCEGKVKLAKLGAPRAVTVFLPPQVPVFLSVNQDSGILSVFAPPKNGDASDQASGAVAKRLHEADWNISGWGRWLDPIVALSPNIGSRLLARTEPIVGRDATNVVRALLGHIYDAGFGVRASDQGLIAEASITTFAADEQSVYDTYSTAVIDLVRSGRIDAYQETVNELAGSAPSSLAAKQKGSRALPVAPLAAFGAIIDYLQRR